MSIIIENMEMPKYCEDCHFVYDSFGYCSMADKDIEDYSFRNGKNERPKWCPLKENTELENQTSVIAELEKIKAEIGAISYIGSVSGMISTNEVNKLIDEHISELKGENNDTD